LLHGGAVGNDYEAGRDDREAQGERCGNEANTKALLIEPLIASLGWDPVDLDAVEREVKVFEGTFLALVEPA
jgi:hypothetical protein